MRFRLKLSFVCPRAPAFPSTSPRASMFVEDGTSEVDGALGPPPIVCLRLLMSNTLEIHGLGACPFAWRGRIAATLKNVPFEWIAHDAPSPDPRSAEHNPGKRSPLLWDDGFAIVESSVIAAYIDESCEGPALQPDDAKGRALARLAIVEMGGLMMPPVHLVPELPPPVRKKVEDTLVALERRLADGRRFLDGDAPGLVDVHAWPGLALLATRGIDVPATHANTRAYWERSRSHEAFASTKPPSL